MRGRWLLVVLATVMLGGVVSCAGSGGGGGMPPEESRRQVVDFVRDSAKRVPVEGWWPKTGTAYADVCSLGGGEKGAEYSYDYWAPRGTDFEGDARRVAEYWRSLGMSVRVTNTTPYPTVYGEGGPVLRAIFVTAAADDMYNVGAVMPCIPGNDDELNKADQRRRDAGEVLPGDEGARRVYDPRREPQTPATPGPTRPAGQ
ncbi:hypothetical protein [Rathayibacter toxicus]|uniref:hypothetical protein n=1 Tax=Rathayibacter toxicus TaxID=145458 RepID=UPI001C052007|nr:hypothetical protein [Rathayibacter toxicus]QWL29745.1 hypothetical protein E2R34_02585 [Rathayibacter toxicus]